MRFKKLDLNLLVALDALLTERSITRAAEKLHLTQPAMSNALSRLRDYFQDDLLTHVGRSMEPTARARALEGSVKDLLARIDATLYDPNEFDPAQSQREFTLYVTDLSMTTLLPQMQILAAEQGSRVRLKLKLPQRDLWQLLERRELDLLVAPLAFCSREHPTQELFDIEHVCVMWNQSQIANKPMTHEVYRDAWHAVRVLTDETMQTAFNAWFLEHYGTSCRTGLSTYSYSAMPWLVVGTEMIATVPKQIVQQVLPTAPIRMCPLPGAPLKLRQAMQWHQQRSEDPGLKWLRGLALQAAERMNVQMALSA